VDMPSTWGSSFGYYLLSLSITSLGAFHNPREHYGASSHHSDSIGWGSTHLCAVPELNVFMGDGYMKWCAAVRR